MKKQYAYSFCDAMNLSSVCKVPEISEYIYLGSYFCDRYFCGISEKVWNDAFSMIREIGKKAVLVIPTASQKQLNQVKQITETILNNYSDAVSEISANDFAMLQWISSFSDVKLWCGRTMSKETRDPRCDIPRQTAKLYERVSEMKVFGIKIAGVEIDPVYPVDVNISENVILGIHVPYAYITFGRHCEIGSYGAELERKFRIDRNCGRQCESNWILYENEKFFKYGRTVYSDNSSIISGISEYRNIRIIDSAISEKIKSYKR